MNMNDDVFAKICKKSASIFIFIFNDVRMENYLDVCDFDTKYRKLYCELIYEEDGYYYKRNDYDKENCKKIQTILENIFDVVCNYVLIRINKNFTL